MKLKTFAFAAMLVSVSTVAFASDKIVFNVDQAYSIDDPNSANLQSADGKQTGLLTCSKDGSNELEFYGEDEGVMANFELSSSSECFALLDKVFGKPLKITLDLANHLVVGAKY